MTDVGNGGLQNAGISPKERLERIETMLASIDEKLDRKADTVLVEGLRDRVYLIEREGSPQVISLERRVNEMDASLRDLTNNASTEAAVRKWKRWLVFVAVPALTATMYTLVKIIEGLAR